MTRQLATALLAGALGAAAPAIATIGNDGATSVGVAVAQVPPVPVPLPPAVPVVPAAPVEVAGTALVGVGDTMQVEGAGIGCQVTQRGGKPAIECRRAGKVAGTYMVVFDEKRARVARFRNATTAKTVFTARHGGRARACKSTARSCR